MGGIYSFKVSLYFATNMMSKVPSMNDNYVPFGRSTRFISVQTNDDHFRREVYISIIDHIIQELDT
jgi:hypothetical protein